MRRKVKLLNHDKHGIYVILELHMDMVAGFFKALNRRLLHSPYGMMEKDANKQRKNRDIPCITNYSVFLNANSQIAYVVLFFWEKEDKEFIDSYLQKLRRRYKITSDITYAQLLAWVETSNFIYHLPGFIGVWAMDSLDTMTLWLSARPGSQAAKE